eukprot:GSMAST32.ASY1.ANO1.1794.1 assembled CDS
MSTSVEKSIQNNPSLPRLPLPNLEDTMHRYLESVYPYCISDGEFEAHQRDVESFINGIGSKLQEELERCEKNSQCSGKYPYSFIERQWDDMYLSGRNPLLINVNPAFILHPNPQKNISTLKNPNPNENTTQVSQAAKFINSSLKWLLKVRLGHLPADGPLPGQCMSQFETFHVRFHREFKLYFLVRKDKQLFNKNAKHIVILHRGHIFKLNVFIESCEKMKKNEILSVETLIKNLSCIVDYCNQINDGPGIGILTSLDRETWYKTRKSLIEFDNLNDSHVTEIDTAILVVTLDVSNCINKNSSNHSQNDLIRATRNGLHGLPGNSLSDRWYDKPTIIIDKNSRISVNFEHSFSDGSMWNRWLFDTLQDFPNPNEEKTKNNETNMKLNSKLEPQTQELNFNIPDFIQTTINESVKKVTDTTNNVCFIFLFFFFL